MAALRPVSSRCGPREEPDGSADSTGTSRTPVLTVSSVSSEPTGSPGQVTEPPGGKSLWEQICEGRRGGTGRPGWDRGAHCVPGG